MNDKPQIEDLARAFLDLWEDHLRAQAQGKQQPTPSGLQDEKAR